jgi:hypothetical protein
MKTYKDFHPLRLSVLLNLIFLCMLACSMGSPRPKVVRDEKDKLYRACESSEAPADVADKGSWSIGRLCSRTCTKKDNKKKCSEWKVTVKDMRSETDFNFIKNGSFVCIPEQYL